MHSLYNIGIQLYSFGVKAAAFFGNEKAKLWVDGRKNWREQLQHWRSEQSGEVVWIHAASLGEFEQGRPVIEAIKQRYPKVKVLLTFFSPSGYEIRKNYNGADLIMYLPADTPSNARDFCKLVAPTLTIFVKYEYWANYFFEIKKSPSKLWVISGIFREQQRFFGSQKSFWSTVLNQVDHYFLQNNTSLELLRKVSDAPALVCGDTRYDRVEAIASDKKDIVVVSQFAGNKKKIIVGGSTYTAEEGILKNLLVDHQDLGVILAPHEINEERIQAIEKLFGKKCIRYSQWNQASEARCLIIDNMGILSQLYRYGNLALIGGGFGKGLHNILEATVYGLPVFFGPNYQKFQEAQEVIACGGGESSASELGLQKVISSVLLDEKKREMMSISAREMVENNLGAVDVIMKTIEDQWVLEE
ncbi:MAG: glycosyltransferase N-terminal domain-containing protein [Flavobacteriales bacterium]